MKIRINLFSIKPMFLVLLGCQITVFALKIWRVLGAQSFLEARSLRSLILVSQAIIVK